MGKKGKKAQAGKPKKLTPKDIGKRLDALAKKLEEELKDADLFAPFPPAEDCPICMVPMSRLPQGSHAMPCCGNLICCGCYKENRASVQKEEKENSSNNTVNPHDVCSFCRSKLCGRSDEGSMVQLERRIEKHDDPSAYNSLGWMISRGRGTKKNALKALDYFIRGAELGSKEACANIGLCYRDGDGVSQDTEKELFFLRIAALRGEIISHHNLGCLEYDLRNYDIAIRHWKVAAEAGSQHSLNQLKRIYNANGKKPGREFISKDYLDWVYRECHEAQREVRTENREKYCTKASKIFRC